jgi:hypothetical protein
MQSKNLNNAYLQCIANIGCNITINLKCDYLKSNGDKVSNNPNNPCPDAEYHRILDSF